MSVVWRPFIDKAIGVEFAHTKGGGDIVVSTLKTMQLHSSYVSTTAKLSTVQQSTRIPLRNCVHEFIYWERMV